MADNEYVDKDTVATQQQESEAKSAKKKKKPAGEKSKPNAFAQILNGEFLTREFVVNNLNFIFFIILLMLLIVGKGYYGKQLSKDVDNAQTTLDDVTADYVEAKAKLEENTRRYRLVEKLGPSGLKETVNPTNVIRLKKEDK